MYRIHRLNDLINDQRNHHYHNNTNYRLDRSNLSLLWNNRENLLQKQKQSLKLMQHQVYQFNLEIILNIKKIAQTNIELC